MGGVISGYLETGIPCRVNKPIITIKIEMTIAKMGRLIKNSLINTAIREVYRGSVEV